MPDRLRASYREMEQERARLLSENALLDQEVKELHGYIDNHLARWFNRIIWLRAVCQFLQGRKGAKYAAIDNLWASTLGVYHCYNGECSPPYRV